MLRIHGFSLLINATVPSTAFQQINDCTPTDTTFILWQPLLTCFVIHSILPCIIIAVLHHGKVPLINHHPNTELLHHSEATGWCAHRSLNEMTWLMWVPSQLRQLQPRQLQTTFIKAVTLPRPQENVTPCVLLSTMTITQKSTAKQHLLIHSSLSKTIQLQSEHGNIDDLLLLSKAKGPYVHYDFTKLRPYSLTKMLIFTLFINSYL